MQKKTVIVSNVLKSLLGFPVKVRRIKTSNESMKKSLFIKTLNKLKEIEDKREFLVTELGVDLTYYEESYFEVILNLFRLTFNSTQVEYIQYFLYETLPDKEWDGTLVLEIAGKEQKVPFSTPSDLWEALKEIK